MQHVIKTASTAQTDTDLVAAVAGTHYEIFGFYGSADTAMQLDMEDGSSTLLHRQHLAANGGQIPAFHPGKQPLWVTTAGNAITYTTSVAGNVAVEIWYDAIT